MKYFDFFANYLNVAMSALGRKQTYRSCNKCGIGAADLMPGPLRDVLSLDEVAAPECEEGHVLVSVNYAGVQYPDALQAQGLYQERPPLPYVPGMDLTGTVLEVGGGVSGLQKGDRVIAQMSTGALAEVVSVDARSVWKAPDNVPLEKCANIGRNFFAAYHSLKIIGEVSEGDLVLVDGASGGVGMQHGFQRRGHDVQR